MKIIFIFLIVICLSLSSQAQSRWIVGTYFIPAYLKYDYAQQSVNINLISGLNFGREISHRFIVNSGIFYFRNSLNGGFEDCYYCAPDTKIAKHKNKFFEIMLGGKFLLIRNSCKLKPHLMLGVITNFYFNSYETNINSIGVETNYYDKGPFFHLNYGYSGISFHYEFKKHTILFIDPLFRFKISEADSFISYKSLFGLGIGVNIKF